MAAQERARFEPERDGFVNAIHVYPYLPGGFYRLYASPGQVSAIALEPGETLVSAAAGDTLRWVLGDTVSGAGSARRVHMLVKPVLDVIATNLVIATDRRVYHLELEATPETYMASVSWTYPQGSIRPISTSATGSRATIRPGRRSKPLMTTRRMTRRRISGSMPAAPSLARLGAAWRETTSGEEPRDYLAIQLDGPSFAEPIRAAFFENVAEGTGVLVWNRRDT